MMFAENSPTEQGRQPYKYNGKELDQNHELNQYDYSARHYDPGYGRFTTPDPHSENYYSWSPYVYVVNNPMKYIDPDGKDYWSTNDPEEIKKLWAVLSSNNKFSNNKSLTFGENFNTSSWTHVSDKDFVGGLTFNDETQTFFTSYVTKEGNDYVVNGISISATNFDGNSAYIESDRGKRTRKASGRIEQTNIEITLAFSATSTGWKALLGIARYFWNTMSGGYNTTNTFDASKSGFAFKGGKQSARDASIKQYPTAFQRWYHKFYKDGKTDATRAELKELYNEWINMGKPTVK